MTKRRGLKAVVSALSIALVVSLIPGIAFAEVETCSKMDSRMNLLQDNSENVFSGALYDGTVDYDYQIAEADEDEHYNATLSFEVLTQEGDKTIDVSGTLDKTKDFEGNWFLVGPLEGTTVIKGTRYDVTVGFTKDLRNGQSNAGVILSSSDDLNEQVIFSFGDRIERKDGDFATESSMLQNESTIGIEPLAFSTLFTGVTATLKNVSSVNGVSISGGYESSSNRAKVYIKSKLNDVKTYYKNLMKASTTVKIDELRVGLKRTTSTNTKTYIAGWESVDVNPSGSTGVIATILADFLSYMNAPSSVTSALAGSNGSITYGNATNNKYINIDFAATAKANFDETSFPVVFQLTKSSTSGGAVTENYQYYGTVYYYVSCIIPGSGGTTFYPKSNQASTTKALKVS